jgi:hypothetical protein
VNDADATLLGNRDRQRGFVTVSMAEQSGICKRMPRVNWVDVSVSVGSTSERAGTSNTSSKVSPSEICSVIMAIQRYSLEIIF